MTEKFPKPFEFLNDQTEEYIEWYVWAFEKKYGKGSWEKTLAEKRKEYRKENLGNEHGTKDGKGDDDEWRKG